MPAFPSEAYHLMKIAIRDDNPVIFIENRWCHYSTEKKISANLRLSKTVLLGNLTREII